MIAVGNSMNVVLAILISVWLGARAPQVLPPSESESARIIESAREQALHYSSDLPNFICTENIVRSETIKRTQVWKRIDKLEVDLAYTSNGESAKLLAIDDKPTTKSYSKVGGAKSTGDFGSMLDWTFRPKSETKFRFENYAELRGRSVYVFSFKVDKSHSEFRVSWDSFFKHSAAITGFIGSVYVDRETYRVLRITYGMDAVPKGVDITSASSVLDYDFVEIGEQKFFLPLHAEMHIARQDGNQLRNEMDFTNYRKFSSDAVLNFEPQP
jgi:hypothetical protein